MQVPNDEWVALTPTNGDKFTVQNVGHRRIGFQIRGTAPSNVAPVDDGSHGELLPGMAPMNLDGLATASLTMYVRTLGPGEGILYVT